MHTHHRFIQMSALALGIVGALAIGQAQASGFQLKENSVKAQGRSFAGSGVAKDDASVVVNNPASMTEFEGTTVQNDVTVIDLGFNFEGRGTDALGRPLTGGDGGDAGGLTPVPALSVIHKLDNGLTLGAMIHAPFGLKTEYDRGWQGRYKALKSEVKIVDLTLSGAYEIVPDHLSVGVGAIFEKAEVTLSNSVDFGTLLFASGVPGFLPQSADGEAVVTGDNVGFGWMVGVNFRPTERLALGLSHRSEIDHDLEGSADWTVPGNARTVLNAVGRGALFNDGAVRAKLTTPSITSFSASYDINEAFTVYGNYDMTDWHSIEEVRIDFVNPDPDSVEDFSWKDTIFWSVGADWRISETLTLRGGYAFDETPTSIATRTPRLPDEDRNWYSLGLTWNATESLEVNAAYTRIKPNTPRIRTTNSFGHTLVGEYESGVNLFGLSAQLKF